MRTDPRPEVVREIVERAFRDYLPPRVSRFTIHKPAPTAPRAAFPRLYDPASEDDDENSRAERAPTSRRPRTVRMAVRPSRCSADSHLLTLDIDETILIDEGRYVARCYRARGYMAMWLIAVGIVQFYDDAGQMLATINLFETLRPKRMAA
jgi:hypothetical protein